MDMDTLLNVDNGKAGVTMKKSLIRHCKPGLRMTTAKSFGKYIVAGSYCGSLVYAELCQLQNTMQTYGGQFMKATNKTPQRWTGPLHEKSVDR